MLHEVLSAITHAHKLGHEDVGVEHAALRGDDGLHVLQVESLDERPHRRHKHARRPLGIAQAPHGAQPPAHGLHRRADPLERQRLPGREQLHGVGADVLGEVVGQVLGRGTGGEGDHDRTAVRQVGQGGHGEGARRLRHGEDGGMAAGDLTQCRFVAQQRGEGG